MYINIYIQRTVTWWTFTLSRQIEIWCVGIVHLGLHLFFISKFKFTEKFLCKIHSELSRNRYMNQKPSRKFLCIHEQYKEVGGCAIDIQSETPFSIIFAYLFLFLLNFHYMKTSKWRTSHSMENDFILPLVQAAHITKRKSIQYIY